MYGSYCLIINKLRSLNAMAKIILITPMQRSDFVYINNRKNNAWGSYKDKSGQSLQQFAAAIDSIGKYEDLRKEEGGAAGYAKRLSHGEIGKGLNIYFR